MTAADNKQLLQRAFEEFSRGNGRPFTDLWADDFCWTVTGHAPWSKTYRGKQTVLKELIAPLFANFATQYSNTAFRFIAEDDYVVVECRGQVTTKSGKPYNNTYCYVCRIENGKLKELTEYMDTALVAEVLAAPASAAASKRDP
jgi:ketosteroid isomerase-like protein